MAGCGCRGNKGGRGVPRGGISYAAPVSTQQFSAQLESVEAPAPVAEWYRVDTPTGSVWFVERAQAVAWAQGAFPVTRTLEPPPAFEPADAE